MLTAVIARVCKQISAADFSEKMLRQTRKKCRVFSNVALQYADILSLDGADGTFDVVLTANVMHLLDEPIKVLRELDRACRDGGKIIIPTYMNREKTGQASSFSKTVGKAGADFKQAFTLSSYQQFFRNAGYDQVNYHMIEGRVPCAVAVITKTKALDEIEKM